ncbi:hypothetical protein EGW67_14110 [Enterococcus faecium]|nr:hypothetical protein EGW67_14110 [Enterococcus faecium]
MGYFLWQRNVSKKRPTLCYKGRNGFLLESKTLSRTSIEKITFDPNQKEILPIPIRFTPIVI